MPLGETIFVGVPAGVCNEYFSSLEAGCGGLVWGLGCVDHVWGYAATSEILRDGGYEADGFCPDFDVRSVNANIEMHLRAAI